MKRLAKSFELSSCAASLVGPKIFRPRARKRLTIPAASGASGPTTVSMTFFPLAKSASASGSVSGTFSSRLARRAGVARRDENLLQAGRLRQAPGQGVFATAGTDDQ
jgi:hypothetical protein